MQRVCLWFLGGVLFGLGLSGCTKGSATPASNNQPADPPVKAAPQTPLAEKKEGLGSAVAWTPA